MANRRHTRAIGSRTTLGRTDSSECTLREIGNVLSILTSNAQCLCSGGADMRLSCLRITIGAGARVSSCGQYYSIGSQTLQNNVCATRGIANSSLHRAPLKQLDRVHGTA